MTKQHPTVDAILTMKNWTGLSLSDLARAGRIVPGEKAKDWAQEYINENYESLSIDEDNLLDFLDAITVELNRQIAELNAE